VESGINNADFGADVETVGVDTTGLSDEITLHLFFKNLGTEYQVFRAFDEQSFGEAIAIIDAQQNLPLTYFERVPGVDYSRWLFLGALIGCVGLAILSVLRLETLA
jgi:mxaC protein